MGPWLWSRVLGWSSARGDAERCVMRYLSPRTSENMHFHFEELTLFFQSIVALPTRFLSGDGWQRLSWGQLCAEPAPGGPEVVDRCPVLPSRHIYPPYLAAINLQPRQERCHSAFKGKATKQCCSLGCLCGLHFCLVIQGGAGCTTPLQPSSRSHWASVAGTADYFKHPSANMQLQVAWA